MRFETIKASYYLVWKMKLAGIPVIDDGGDIILAAMPSGETISIHLIESPLPVYEIRSILNDNEARGYYTLFVLWCDLLLPPEGHVVETYDWEVALLELYGDRIYAFEIFGDEVFVFPVHFEPEGRYRHIRYGYTVRLADLSISTVNATCKAIAGTWHVVGFRPHERGAGEQPDRERGSFAPEPSKLADYYVVLEIGFDARPDDVKFAYRRLARRYHPDLNQSPDATAKMQAVNEAYERIMQQFDGEE